MWNPKKEKYKSLILFFIQEYSQAYGYLVNFRIVVGVSEHAGFK